MVSEGWAMLKPPLQLGERASEDQKKEPQEKEITVAAIEECCDVRLFFRDRLHSAFAERRTRASTATHGYLLGLLTDAAGPDNEPSLEPPLVTLLERAHAADGLQRLARFRQLGDAAIMIYGFFSDAMTRRGISESYVRTMGSCGYASASSLIPATSKGKARGLAAVYRELSVRFEELGEVLAEVRDQTPLSERELVRLYERWSVCGSPRLARRLARNGMVPAAGLGLGSN